MFTSFINFLKGYLRIEIKGYYPERFLNLCKSNNIKLWKLVCFEDGFEFYISIKDFWKLKELLRKTKNPIKIRQKYGLPIFLFKYKKRKLFFVGFLMCLAIIMVMSRFIWEIDFVGNLSITDDVLIEYLESENISSGMKIDDIDSEEIQKGIRNNFKEIIWTSVEISGCKLIISVKENQTTSVIKEESFGNIIAKKSGIIKKIITRTGTPLVKVGDQISKNDILIEGQVPIYNDAAELVKYNACTPDGDILAETKYEYMDSFSLNYINRSYTDKINKYMFLKLYNNYFYLKPKKTDFENYSSYTTQNQLTIGHNLFLPIYFGKVTDSEYILENKTYSEYEAKQIAEKKLQLFYENLKENGVQIVENNVTIEVNDNECITKGDIIVIEPIGVFSSVPNEDILNE